ncbi:MAG: LuxR C-terminal-related transcriptional regulator [Proteobacteria bacterium]|nr:LuxR C-terminal-related transcriptional regulator [Pseudomonadota bacterium]
MKNLKIEYRAFFGLAFYVFWLVSFPMAGFLMGNDITPNKINYFLIPHIITFFFVCFFLDVQRLEKFSTMAIILTALLTISYTFAGSLKNFVLSILGISSVFPALKAILIFKDIPQKIEFSCAALILGNFLTFLLTLSPLSNISGFIIISFLLLFIALVPSIKNFQHGSVDLKKTQLLIIFVFYFTGGLMYDFFLPNYSVNSFLPNYEIIFYILGVLFAIFFIKKDLEMTLAIGILFSSLSFFLYKIETHTFINVGMYFSQISFGVVDAFFINLLILLIPDFKKLTLTFITMLTGILVGKIICFYLQNKLSIIIESGNLFLIISAILLYFSSRVYKKTEEKKGQLQNNKETEERNFKENQIYKKLSEQEKKVLEMVFQDKNYNVIAEEMDISVSTVKTYMKRIFEKTNTKNKEELINKFKKE